MHYDTPFERFYFNCMREIVYLLKYMPLCLKLATHYWFVCTPVWVVSSAPLILHREETKIQLWILFAFKWGFLGRLEREGEKIIDQSSLFFLHLPISCPSLPPVCLPLLNDLWIFGKTGRTIISPWMCHVFSISHCCYYAMLVIYQQSNHFLLLIFVFILHAIKKKHDSLSLSLSLSTDFSLSSNWEASPAALLSAAWTTSRPSPIVVTTLWTASVANCRLFSGAVTVSPIHLSRFRNSPPAVTTVHSVASGTTWRPY